MFYNFDNIVSSQQLKLCYSTIQRFSMQIKFKNFRETERDVILIFFML